MKSTIFKSLTLFTLILTAAIQPCHAQVENTLTKKEKKEGWQLLFDGKTLNGWRRIYSNEPPTKGWKAENGCLVIEAAQGGESSNVGDLATTGQYDDFEICWEFKLTKDANTGLKYYVDESLAGENNVAKGYAFGLEYQMIDDLNHKKGPTGGLVGGLYELIDASSEKEVRPFGKWNQGRIVSRNNHVEHWLNGKKVVEYERGSTAFNTLIAKSKFKNTRNYGLKPKGSIVFQDHGCAASFRNIKIRIL